MDCSGIMDHLSPLLDGELEGDKAETVRAHLAKCPRCSKSFQDHMSVKQLLSRRLFMEKAPPRLRSAILDRLDSSRVGDFFSVLLGKLRVKPLLASGLAAMLLLVISASVLFLVNSPRVPSLILELLSNYAEASLHPLEVVSANAGHVAQKMSQSFNRDIGVADLKCKWCFLRGARKCPFRGNPALEIRYLHPTGHISFFMVLDAGKKAIAKLRHSGTFEEKQLDGARYLHCEKKCARAIVWWEGDHIFLVTSGRCLPPAALLDVAAEIRRVCRLSER